MIRSASAFLRPAPFLQRPLQPLPPRRTVLGDAPLTPRVKKANSYQFRTREKLGSAFQDRHRCCRGPSMGQTEMNPQASARFCKNFGRTEQPNLRLA